MIPTQGKVFIDGIDTSTINLQALRSAITIVSHSRRTAADKSDR